VVHRKGTATAKTFEKMPMKGNGYPVGTGKRT